MEGSAWTLAGTALTIAVVHTAIGVDHYLPFIAMGRAQGWSLRKTLVWTTICGLGHILSSVVLAAVAGGVGWAVGNIESVDAIRGDTAAYLLLAFGAAYGIWGLTRVRHSHTHSHGPEHSHSHSHSHKQDHDDHQTDDEHHRRPHASPTLWALFIIFVLGPCEPLIPLMVAPALTHNLMGALLVVGGFAIATISTMLVLVTVGYLGIGLLRLSLLERWAHPLAGFAIVVSGCLILIGL